MRASVIFGTEDGHFRDSIIGTLVLIYDTHTRSVRAACDIGVTVGSLQWQASLRRPLTDRERQLVAEARQKCL